MKTRTLTREQFADILAYDPETGALSWLPRSPEMFTPPRAEHKASAWNARFAGRPVTFTNPDGYVVVQIGRKPFMAHRVIFALQEGECPGGRQVDHINGERADNRWENLRLVTPLANQWNKKRTTAARQGAGPAAGVKQNAAGRWECRIKVLHAFIYLGTFDTEAEALAARQAAERTARSLLDLPDGPCHGKSEKDHPLL